MIKTENGVKPTISMLKDGKPIKGQLLLNRIPIKDVPIDDDAKLTEFLYKIYENKVILMFSSGEIFIKIIF